MTFENYLINRHAGQYRGLDDEMPEDFDSWLEDLGPDDWIEYAEFWTNKE